MIASSNSNPPSIEMSQISNAAGVILKGVESYLQEIINASVRSQLTALGITPTVIDKESALLLSEVTDHRSKDCPDPPSDSGVVSSTEKGRTSIAEAIKSYLKDVEPPQREQKTYDEYRLVLHKFRDTCGKRYLQEINRDDCLGFMRHLYSIGNEARTVFNRMGIVQQCLCFRAVAAILTAVWT